MIFSSTNFVFWALVHTSFIVVCEEVGGGGADYIQGINDLMRLVKPHFIEPFSNCNVLPKKWIISEAKKWIISEAKKDGVEGDLAKYDGDWTIDQATKNPIPGDYGLTFKQKAKHRAIAAKMNKDFVFKDKPLIVQYEVLFQETQECGGAYMKLLSSSKDGLNLELFHDKTPYTIMFGPDKCGTTLKIHMIFRHRNPLNGSYEEKHFSKPISSRIDEFFSDGQPHLYTLIVSPTNTFKVMVDQVSIMEGSLLEDFTPPVNPPAMIDDPTDKKPDDWDEREKIPDPSATKPEDWDESAPRTIPDESAEKPENWLENEPLNIVDPLAEKPEDWDDTMDGEWEAPLIPNPACEEATGCGPWSRPLINNPNYKGKWSPPLISNPNYKGKWAPRKIKNPDFFEDKDPFKMTPITAVGFELWSITPSILFDNILVTDDEKIVNQWTAATFSNKVLLLNKNAGTLWNSLIELKSKLGWWLLYFMFLLMLVGLYIRYLYQRSNEDTALNRFLAFTNKNPWLWAVFTVILLIPVTLIFYCCCWSTKESNQESTESYKKTDGDIKEEPEQEEEPLGSPEPEGSGTLRKRVTVESPREDDQISPSVDDANEKDETASEYYDIISSSDKNDIDIDE